MTFMYSPDVESEMFKNNTVNMVCILQVVRENTFGELTFFRSNGK